MRRVVLLLFCLVMLVTTVPVHGQGRVAAQATAEQEIVVKVNGVKLTFDVAPVMLNQRILVPFRAIFQALGATVVWDEESRAVFASRGSTSVQLAVGQRSAKVNSQAVSLNVEPLILSGRVLVPLRFVSEAFGAGVNWDEETKSVSITDNYISELEGAASAGNIGKPLPDAGAKVSKAPGTVGDVVDVADRRESVVFLALEGGDGEKIGSGVVVDAGGVILTNYHVIDGAIGGVVTASNGTKYPIVGVMDFDAKLDVAVIKIDAVGLSPVELGDSDSVKVGQAVVAIGNPMGLQNTVSTGVVSGVREIDGRRLIQTSAPVTHGSSGGGLFDMSGRLIGIIVAGIKGGGDLNFAIPVNDAKALTERASIAVPLSDMFTTRLRRPVASRDESPPSVVTFSDYASWLKDNVSVQNVGPHVVEFNDVLVWESSDGQTAFVSFELDFVNYYWYLRGILDGGSGDVETFLTLIAKLTSKLFPGYDVFGGIAVTGHTYYYPTWCDPDDVRWMPELKVWSVYKIVVTVSDFTGRPRVEFQ